MLRLNLGVLVGSERGPGPGPAVRPAHGGRVLAEAEDVGAIGAGMDTDCPQGAVHGLVDLDVERVDEHRSQ